MNPLTLPLYRCHKEVRAAQILDIEVVSTYPIDAPEVTGAPGEVVEVDSVSAAVLPVEVGLRLTLSNLERVTITADFYVRRRPLVGDYYVDYGDYQSLSPQVAFEAGYSLVHATKEAQDQALAEVAAERAADSAGALA